jgi:hypothetical protein
MPASENFFCSALAREHNVPLVGTATRGDVWFLLEYTGRWGAKALEEGSLPAPVRQQLAKETYPAVEARPLLIRQEGSPARSGLRFFVGQTHLQTPRLYEYHLEGYTDLLDIDLAAYAAGEPGDPAHLRAEPLYLVCTNGRRDQCCARYGPEIYRAMVNADEEATWQSAHIGGHNKAPVNLFFPHGVHYGQATPEQIGELMRAYREGRVVLSRYRGRVCYAAPAQAAEHFWREQTGVLDLPGMSVENVETLNENEWRVTVRGLESGASETIHVQRRLSDFTIPVSCTGEKLRPVETFVRVAGG